MYDHVLFIVLGLRFEGGSAVDFTLLK